MNEFRITAVQLADGLKTTSMPRPARQRERHVRNELLPPQGPLTVRYRMQIFNCVPHSWSGPRILSIYFPFFCATYKRAQDRGIIPRAVVRTPVFIPKRVTIIAPIICQPPTHDTRPTICSRAHTEISRTVKISSGFPGITTCHLGTQNPPVGCISQWVMQQVAHFRSRDLRLLVVAHRFHSH